MCACVCISFLKFYYVIRAFLYVLVAIFGLLSVYVFIHNVYHIFALYRRNWQTSLFSFCFYILLFTILPVVSLLLAVIYYNFCKSCSYWLQLRCGIVHIVQCNCDHLLIYCAPHLSSNHSRLIHQNSLPWLHKRHLIAKWEEMSRNFAYKCLFLYL
jgi:ABC-type transport system involved in multi-copper enzyme maturation permease subunit